MMMIKMREIMNIMMAIKQGLTNKTALNAIWFDGDESSFVDLWKSGDMHDSTRSRCSIAITSTTPRHSYLQKSSCWDRDNKY